jgi:hypothetical protein
MKPEKRTGAHVHLLIAKTAQDLCRADFDRLMSHPKLGNEAFRGFRRYFPEGTPTKTLEVEFVKRMWPIYIDPARTTLTALLTTLSNDVLKNEISEALILDSTLKRGRLAPDQFLASGAK